MKKMLTCATCIFIGLCITAEEVKTPYRIQRGEEIIEVYKMPTFTVSEPISNSFVYIMGEYITSPYVVSVTNLAVYINGRILDNYEPSVRIGRDYSRRSSGITPETVGHYIDESAQSWVRRLNYGVVEYRLDGSPRVGFALGNGDGGALGLIEKARKAVQGDEQAKQSLIGAFGLENHLSKLHPDWIERLATNTNLEARATAILEAKKKTP